MTIAVYWDVKKQNKQTIYAREMDGGCLAEPFLIMEERGDYCN